MGNVIILGDGFAGKLAAIALCRDHHVTLVRDPRGGNNHWMDGVPASGKPSHSHIFLPRMMDELAQIAPDFLEYLATQGLAFTPGAKGLRAHLPTYAKRLFATRWQIDAAMSAYLDQIFTGQTVQGQVTGVVQKAGRVHQITLQDGWLDVLPDSWVIDAMGARSPAFASLVPADAPRQQKGSRIAYMTQFFRLYAGIAPDSLPEPLFECSVDFGEVYFSLYPAQDGWFSLTAGFDMSNRALLTHLRDTGRFMAYAGQSDTLSQWLDAAQPHGDNSIYLNPANSWNVDAMLHADMAQNYLAVGDALVTTNPALGAGCSYASSHVRAAKTVLEAPGADYQAARAQFGQIVHTEQAWFFDAAVAKNPPNGPKRAPVAASFIGRPRRRMNLLWKSSTLQPEG